MNFGILADFHLGHTGLGTWHNRLLFEHSDEVVRATVEMLNSQSLDMVIILGDITNNGTEKQLELADKILSKLTMPWILLPGNHDREGIRTGQFGRTFSKHVPDMYRVVAGIPSLFLTEYLPPAEYPKTELGIDIFNKAIDNLKDQNIKTLFIFSHFPLVAQDDYANGYKADYAKHYLDGKKLLNQLEKLVSGKIFCFSAHQHWHRIIDEDRIFHCMTASMIEYPMEVRIVNVDHNKLSVSTLETACPKIAEMSLISAKWVFGRDNDRNWSITL